MKPTINTQLNWIGFDDILLEFELRDHHFCILKTIFWSLRIFRLLFIFNVCDNVTIGPNQSNGQMIGRFVGATKYTQVNIQSKKKTILKRLELRTPQHIKITMKKKGIRQCEKIFYNGYTTRCMDNNDFAFRVIELRFILKMTGILTSIGLFSFKLI